MAVQRGEIDLSDFIGQMKQIVPDIESSQMLEQAMRAGAKIFKTAIERNTPIGKAVYRYQVGGRTVIVRSQRTPGQASRSVIIYKRKRPKGYYQTNVNEALSLLVGYEKKKAFYMFWNEYGSKKQAARPVIRPAFDSNKDVALAASLEFVRRRVAKGKWK